MLEVKGVRVRFGGFVAVKDVTFSLPSGSLLGLIGPNGAGKTTLLRTVAGLQARDAGEVAVLGETLTYERQQLVGFTPDTPPVYEELTVRRFLEFVGLGYGLEPDDIASRTDFWLEKVWLKEKADAKLKGLSRGMRQRVGIARTMLPNPPLVLLDEPAAGLDPAGRVQFRQLLVDLREQGKTLIVSSHILSDMSEYCSHIGIMSAGKLVRFGTVQAIASGDHLDQRRQRYEIRLAKSVAQVDAVLSTIEGVTNVTGERLSSTVEYDAGEEAAANLLAKLVSAGLPVCAFMPRTLNLEEAYLREGIGQVD